MYYFSVITLIFFRLSSANAATLTLYGEDHDGRYCIQQRASLAKEANLNQKYLFSENIFTPVSAKYLKSTYEHFSTRNLNQIYGLEQEKEFYSAILLSSIDQAQKEIAMYNPEEDNTLDLSAGKFFFEQFITEFTDQRENFPEIKKIIEEVYTHGLTEDYEDDELKVYMLDHVKPALIKIKKILNKKNNESARAKQAPEPYTLQGELPFYDQLLFSYPNLISEKLPPELALPIVLFRNYLMAQELNRVLAEPDKNPALDVAVVMGAFHVIHFKYVLEKKYPELAKKYEIKTNFQCFSY